eukprot:c7918_g1_i1.p1 GENE.c7918_g1_i1~~c7918_g1_i1.p1  ORF type:complete len:128 (-),score=15.75 c7918_g1_i1:135-518(-)
MAASPSGREGSPIARALDRFLVHDLMAIAGSDSMETLLPTRMAAFHEELQALVPSHVQAGLKLFIAGLSNELSLVHRDRVFLRQRFVYGELAGWVVQLSRVLQQSFMLRVLPAFQIVDGPPAGLSRL